MNRDTPPPTLVWPYRPRNTRLLVEPPVDTGRSDEGFDDAAARLAGPGRCLQQTMAAMVRIAVAQAERPH